MQEEYTVPQLQPPEQQSFPSQLSRRRRGRLGLIIGAMVVVLALGGVVSSLFIIKTSQSMQRSAVITHPATIKPPSAPITFTATYGIPHIGGPLSDFVGKYGKPNGHATLGQEHFLSASTSNKTSLIVSLYPNGIGFSQEVFGITAAAVNGTWDRGTAQGVCMAFAPGDAYQVDQVTLSDQEGQEGFDVIYVSNTLGHAFSANTFTDVNGATIAPGTFDVQYLYAGDGDETRQIGSCSMQLGALQVQGL